jgi:hypothetical protein
VTVRLSRLDFAITRFDFDVTPAPGRGRVERTADGYLEVDAYIARDGCLVYSDGLTRWHEYRSKDSISQAATSFANLYVTDDHPPVMLDASNSKEYACGVLCGAPTIETIDGVTYLRARLSIRDARLIARIDGGVREVSIGFWSDVLREQGIAPDGTRYDAVQMNLCGNHVAIVDRGRAGPAVRILLDSAHAAIHASPVMFRLALDATLYALATGRARAHKDEAGMPVTEAKLIAPDGSEIVVPTAIAAIVEEWIEMKKAAGKPPAEQPPAPAGDPPPPAEGDEVPPPPAKPEDEDEKKDPPMSADQIAAIVRKRVRLESLANTAECPIVEDDQTLARSVVAKVLPKAKADKLEGAALDAMLDLAAETLASRPKPGANPWERPGVPTIDDEEADYEARATMLRGAGVPV